MKLVTRAVAELLAEQVEGVTDDTYEFTVEDATCVTEVGDGVMQFYAVLDTGESYSVTVAEVQK